MERRCYTVHGRVQGVGFRATTVSIARRFAVTGTVRNLSNGTVEIIAQGKPAELDRFLAEVFDQFAGYIDRMEHQSASIVSAEAEAGFGIAY